LKRADDGGRFPPIFRALQARDEAAVTKTMRSHMDTAAERRLAGYDAGRAETAS
jgi:DNA-binding GntR family transcriptional regulator